MRTVRQDLGVNSSRRSWPSSGPWWRTRKLERRKNLPIGGCSAGAFPSRSSTAKRTMSCGSSRSLTNVAGQDTGRRGIDPGIGQPRRLRRDQISRVSSCPHPLLPNESALQEEPDAAAGVICGGASPHPRWSRGVDGSGSTRPGQSARFEPYGFTHRRSPMLPAGRSAPVRRLPPPWTSLGPERKMPGHLSMAGQSVVEAAGVEPDSSRGSWDA
jgi:hypothetical protein